MERVKLDGKFYSVSSVLRFRRGKFTVVTKFYRDQRTRRFWKFHYVVGEGYMFTLPIDIFSPNNSKEKVREFFNDGLAFLERKLEILNGLFI